MLFYIMQLVGSRLGTTCGMCSRLAAYLDREVGKSGQKTEVEELDRRCSGQNNAKIFSLVISAS